MIEQAALVFAIGPEAEAAAEATKHTHLLHALVTARAGLGVPIYASPERQAKAIRALLPDGKKLGVVYDPSQSSAAVDAYEAAARSAGFRLVRKPVHSRQEVAGALRSIAGGVDGIWLVPDVTVISADTFKFLIELSIENKLPVIGFSAGMAKAGALLAVEATYPEMGRKAAQAARRILTGAESPPQPADGAIYVNSATADLLGVSIPSEVRDQAAEVFE
jgi:putative ABC transport system substrate-binding protein